MTSKGHFEINWPLSNIKTKIEISSNFVALSENLNFIEVLNEETYAIEFGLVSFSGLEEILEIVGLCLQLLLAKELKI